jgi:hypothetical protein
MRCGAMPGAGPDAFDPEDLDALRANMHNPDFEMLYQQDVDGTALSPIANDCFPSFGSPPSRDLACVMSVDAGMTAGSRNSFSAIHGDRAQARTIRASGCDDDPHGIPAWTAPVGNVRAAMGHG